MKRDHLRKEDPQRRWGKKQRFFTRGRKWGKVIFYHPPIQGPPKKEKKSLHLAHRRMS